MNIITDLVRNIMLIILLTTFLEMMMPSNNMQRFIKVVMGLFVLIAILNPLLGLINQQENLSSLVWQAEDGLKFKSISEQEERLQKVNQDLLWENYQQRVERQMKSLVKLVRGVGEAEVQVKLSQTWEGDNKISFEKIIITVFFEEQTTNVEKRETRLIENDINEIVCQYLGLQKRQIKVDFI